MWAHSWGGAVHFQVHHQEVELTVVSQVRNTIENVGPGVLFGQDDDSGMDAPEALADSPIHAQAAVQSRLTGAMACVRIPVLGAARTAIDASPHGSKLPGLPLGGPPNVVLPANMGVVEGVLSPGVDLLAVEVGATHSGCFLARGVKSGGP